MRITVSHNKRKEEAAQIIDSALLDAMKAMSLTSVEISDFDRKWNNNVMTFSLAAKTGFLRKRIQGTVEVTDSSIIVDADLGFLEKLLPEEKVKVAIQNKVDRLLT